MKTEVWLFNSYSFLLITTIILMSSKTNGEMTDGVAQLVDPCCYDKWSRPDPNHKTSVYVHMHVYSIGSIDAQNLHYKAHILLRYRWNDPRLKQDRFLKFEGGLMMEKIWSPHLYIVNEYEAKLMGSFPKDITMSIWPDGTVVYLARLMVTLRCVMDLQKFPFDSQCCPLIMESWSYNASHLELIWELSSPVSVNNLLQLPEYSLVNVEVNSSINEYQQMTSSSMDEHISDHYGKVAKNFSTLAVYFTVKRQYGFYLMNYYVPSILIVVVSWVTFWLDANSVPGRTVLGTSTFLTFITLSRNIENSLPKVSYIKSSEIWFIGCTGFIFSSLAEFAFVNIIWRRKKNVDLKKVTGKHILQSTLTPQMYHKHLNINRSKSASAISSISNSSLQLETFSDLKSNGQFQTSLDSICPNPFPTIESGDINDLSEPKELEEKPTKSLFTMTPQEIANWIDRRSRLVFPIAFVVFNFLYWTWTLVLL